MEVHKSMRAVYQYEANYINAVRFWISLHQAALSLRHEALEENKTDVILMYDVWAIILIRYGLRVTGLRAKLYKLVARDPVYTKMVLPSLDQRNDTPAAEDLVEPLEKLDTNMSTQLMKEVTNLSASNATKRADKGGAIGDN